MTIPLNMDFRKVKRLHSELHKELERISDALTKKFDRDMCVSPTSDGLCVIFEDQNMTGVTLDEFEKLSSAPDFDVWSIQTVL